MLGTTVTDIMDPAFFDLRSPGNLSIRDFSDLSEYDALSPVDGDWTEYVKTEPDDDANSLISGDELSRKERIMKFLEENNVQCTSMKDVPVTAMRHIMSLLLMEVYQAHYVPGVRKVKGIWKNPPPGWPSHVNFVDPNNKMRTADGCASRKPKKELLIPMLQHLVEKFLKMQAPTGHQMLQPVQVEAVTEDELSSIMDCDWDRELVERLRPKLIYLYKTGHIDYCMFCKLLSVHGGWLHKSGYTEADISDIHNLDMLLHKVKIRGQLAPDLRAELDAVAGVTESKMAASVASSVYLSSCNCGSKVRLFGQWMAAICAAAPISLPCGVSHRQAETKGSATLSELNIASRTTQNPLLMPTDDFSMPDPGKVAYVKQRPNTRQEVLPDDKVVSQLNIRQRTNGEVNRLMAMEDLELRPQYCPDQPDIKTEKKLAEVWFPDLDDGDINLMEVNPGDFPVDTDLFDQLLNSLNENEAGSSYASAALPGGSHMEDEVFEDEKQGPVMSFNIASGLSSSPVSEIPVPWADIGGGPGLTSQPFAGHQYTPMSTAMMGSSVMQQMMVDSGTQLQMAISGSVGPPVPVTHLMPMPIPVPVPSSSVRSQAVWHREKMPSPPSVIPSVVEDQESDDEMMM